jgi:RluA family pseudouridine synthase
VAKPPQIELGDGTLIPILYEDRSVLAIDKPTDWLLAPDSWQQTGRNLQLALQSSLKAGDFWARSRSLKYLRFVHRLDAETSGVLLLAKSAGALRTYSELFELRRIEKHYLAVVRGVPSDKQWTCDLKLGPHPTTDELRRVDPHGQEAQTHFRLLKTRGDSALIQARPTTGRTHQIRVHLAAAGHPVLGDSLYGARPTESSQPTGRGIPEGAPSRQPGRRKASLALRAVLLAYRDPFTKKEVRIQAPFSVFVRRCGFDLAPAELFF